MKIALYVHCFYPKHYHGTEAYTLMVAKELSARGHQPTVVTATFQGEPAQSQFIEERSWDGIPVISIDKNQHPNQSVRDTYYQPVMQDVHESILRRLRPDVVHVCHLVNHTAALLFATRALGIPTVATFTDFFGFCYTNILEAADGTLCHGPNPKRTNCIACQLKATLLAVGAEQNWRTHVFPRIWSPAAKFLALLGRIRDRAYFGFRPGDLIRRPDILFETMRDYRVAIVATKSVGRAYRRVGFSTPMMLSRFGISVDRSPKPIPQPRGTIRIGYIGQLTRHKGVHILIDAFRAAAKPNLSLNIWGDQNDKPAYFQQLQKSSAGLSIEFRGTFSISEVARVLSEVDVLVIPSTWYENSPLILLYALATHTPVIISDVPGMTEIVEDGVNSFRFPRGDTAALTSILCRVADADGLLAEMSRRTEYRRSCQDMVDDVVIAYEIALGTRHRVAPPQYRTSPSGSQ